MDIRFDVHPVIVFAIAMGASVALFIAVRVVLNILYDTNDTTLIRWYFFKQYVQKIRTRGLPLIAKYGSIGLVAFVAVPIPATGVCAATLLSWLLGMKWHVSLALILPGAAISNGIVTLSALGIIQGINLTAG